MLNSIKKLDLKKTIVIILAVLPILYFFWNIHRFAVNIPYNDDYETVLGFMNDYLPSKRLIDTFNFIIARWNEHRQPFNKLVTIALYHLTGQVDFKVMIYIGNFALLIITFCLYKAFNLKDGKLAYFLPAIFFFFQPAYNENIFFGMASLTNFYIMAFGFLSLLILEKYSENSMPKFLLSLFLAVLSYYTQRNGVLILFVGLIYLLYKRKLWQSIIWTAVSCAVFAFYELYNVPASAHTPLVLSWDKISTSVIYFFVFIGNNFGISFSGYYAEKLGSAARYFSIIVPAIAGLAVFTYFIFITIKKYYEKNIILYSIFLFLILSAAGGAWGRSGYGVEQALTSRYRVVTILFYIIGYLSLMETIVNEKVKKAVFGFTLAFSIIFNIGVNILKYKPIIQHRKDLITSLENWKKDHKGIDPLGHPSAYANLMMTDAVNRKAYRPPDIQDK